MMNINKEINIKINEQSMICIDNCYKEANSHKWETEIREVYVLHYIISCKGYL